jgi:hypothetical protein
MISLSLVKFGTSNLACFDGSVFPKLVSAS